MFLSKSNAEWFCWQCTVMEAFRALTSNSSITTKLGFQKFQQSGIYRLRKRKHTTKNDSFAFNKWYLHSLRTSFIKHWFQMPPAPVCKAFYTFYISTHTQSHHSCNAIVQLCLRMDTSALKYWLSLRWCWWICVYWIENSILPFFLFHLLI